MIYETDEYFILQKSVIGAYTVSRADVNLPNLNCPYPRKSWKLNVSRVSKQTVQYFQKPAPYFSIMRWTEILEFGAQITDYWILFKPEL